MATSSKAEEREERDDLARLGREDVDRFMSDDDVIALAIVALRKDGGLGQSIGVVALNSAAPCLMDFGDRIDNALRTQFPRLPA